MMQETTMAERDGERMEIDMEIDLIEVIEVIEELDHKIYPMIQMQQSFQLLISHPISTTLVK